MAEIINLRQHRKQQARNAKAEKAEQNRISHSRSKAEKTSTKANRSLDDQRHDGHRLIDGED